MQSSDGILTERMTLFENRILGETLNPYITQPESDCKDNPAANNHLTYSLRQWSIHELIADERNGEHLNHHNKIRNPQCQVHIIH